MGNIFMKEMTLAQIREAELGILNYIDSICKANNYSYFLAYGTLLGAVRHQGFIPWDDDIDILVPRKEYTQFINTISDEGGRYKVISAYSNLDYKLPFIKVVDSDTVIYEKGSASVNGMGVYVDVFPLDSLPSKEKERKKIKNRAWILRQIMDHASLWEGGRINRSIVYKVLCYLCHCYGWTRAFGQFETLANRSSVFEKSGFYVDLAGSISRSNEWGNACFEEKCFLSFEGKRYPAPYNYNEVLKEYGDYMTLPPMEKRVSNHSFKAYYKA